MPLNRRTFLASSSAAVGVGMPGVFGMPEVFQRAAWAAPPSDAPGGKQTVLVVVQLSGGNDGLNTVVPFNDPVYQASRPTLKQSADKVKKLTDALGLHPALEGLASQWEGSKLGIVQGVGYPRPNRSHFESMDVWHKALAPQDLGAREQRYGWLGRMHTQLGPAGMAVHIGAGDPPLALFGPTGNAPSVRSLEEYQLRVAPRGDDPARRSLIERFAEAKSQIGVESQTGPKNELLDLVRASARETYRSSQRLREATKSYDTPVSYPASGLGNRMKLIARLISAGVPERLYYTTHDGFDTHAIQEQGHPGLLKDLGDSLAAFQKDLEHHGQHKRVIVMTFSEFGRRVKENASQGTDHGAASQMFLVGEAVKPGVHGKHPSLTDLDDGDLKFHTDFRAVYGTLLEKWLGIPAEPVLLGKYPLLDLVRPPA